MSGRVKCVICGEYVQLKFTNGAGWCLDCVEEFNRIKRPNPAQEELFTPVNHHDHEPPPKKATD